MSCFAAKGKCQGEVGMLVRLARSSNWGLWDHCHVCTKTDKFLTTDVVQHILSLRRIVKLVFGVEKSVEI